MGQIHPHTGSGRVRLGFKILTLIGQLGYTVMT